MTLVTVFADKYVRSLPALDEEKPVRQCDRGEVVDVADALERNYMRDAHFATYASPNSHRLNFKSLANGTAIELTCIVFDVDGPGHAEMLVTDPWRRELRNRMECLAAKHPQPFYYETAGGARIVYRQPTPTILRTREDAVEWSRDYVLVVAYLKRQFGIKADPACADWQRLYRLPRATRKGVLQNWPTLGEPTDIGSFVADVSLADVETVAVEQRKHLSPRKTLSFNGTGRGVLFHALQKRGDIAGAHSSGAVLIRCPNESEHTTGQTGDGSTLLYPPDDAHNVGAIFCLHGHCSGLMVRDWLKKFSHQELEAAREAARRDAA
jgi:hypothetical protein